MTAHELRAPGSGRGINLRPVLKLPAYGDLWNSTRAARVAESQPTRALAAAQTSGTRATGAAVFAAKPAQIDLVKQRSAIGAVALANGPAAAGMEPNGKWGFERLRPPPLRAAGLAGRSRFPPHSLLPAGGRAVGGAGAGRGAELVAPAAVPSRRGACLPVKAAQPAVQHALPPPCCLAPPFPARHPHAKTWGRAA